MVRKYIVVLQIILFMAIASIIVIHFTRTTTGKEITVDDDGTSDYTIIQDAIDASTSGDSINVLDGSYNENVVVDKSILLIGSGSANCIISGVGGDVVTITADHVNISGFTVQGGNDYSESGIKVKSDHCTINDNLITDNYYGVVMSYADFCKILSNDYTNNKLYSLRVGDSNYCSVSDNYISMSVIGASFARSDFLNFTNNSVADTKEDGVGLRQSKFAILSNNTFLNSGLTISGESLEHWNTHTVDTANTANSKPIYYYSGSQDLTVPDGAGQIILVSCSNIVVKNQTITNTTDGILVAHSSNVTITNNIFSNNSGFGIHIDDDRDQYYDSGEHSGYHMISNNTCTFNAGHGILLSNSDHNIIRNNTSSNNGITGIQLVSFSQENLISDNYCYDNRVSGICLSHSSHNSLVSNRCGLNRWYGIELSFSDYILLKNNTYENNGEEDFYIYEETDDWGFISKMWIIGYLISLPIGIILWRNWKSQQKIGKICTKCKRQFIQTREDDLLCDNCSEIRSDPDGTAKEEGNIVSLEDFCPNCNGKIMVNNIEVLFCPHCNESIIIDEDGILRTDS